jgi:hypothetical protein
LGRLFLCDKAGALRQAASVQGTVNRVQWKRFGRESLIEGGETLMSESRMGESRWLKEQRHYVAITRPRSVRVSEANRLFAVR